MNQCKRLMGVVLMGLVGTAVLCGRGEAPTGTSIFPKSLDYTVKVNGKPVDVWLAPIPQMSVMKVHRQLLVRSCECGAHRLPHLLL